VEEISERIQELKTDDPEEEVEEQPNEYDEEEQIEEDINQPKIPITYVGNN
jgi:hypothetical protein